jgi:hypothetical protein
LHAAVRRVLRQAWELDDAEKAEKLIRNLARRLEHDAPGMSASILEGLDEILTVTRLGRPAAVSACCSFGGSSTFAMDMSSGSSGDGSIVGAS